MFHLRHAAVSTALLLGFAGSAHAEFYATAGMAIGNYQYSDIDNSTGYVAGFGYRPTPNLAIELQYFDAGDADINDDGSFTEEFPSATFESGNFAVSGFAATAAYIVPAASGSGSNVFFRGGLYSSDTDITITFTEPSVGTVSGTISDSTTNFTLGLGFDWMFSQSLGLRGAVDGMFGNKDYADDEEVTLISLGLIWSFGKAADRSED